MNQLIVWMKARILPINGLQSVKSISSTNYTFIARVNWRSSYLSLASLLFHPLHSLRLFITIAIPISKISFSYWLLHWRSCNTSPSQEPIPDESNVRLNPSNESFKMRPGLLRLLYTAIVSNWPLSFQNLTECDLNLKRKSPSITWQVGRCNLFDLQVYIP